MDLDAPHLLRRLGGIAFAVTITALGLQGTFDTGAACNRIGGVSGYRTGGTDLRCVVYGVQHHVGTLVIGLTVTIALLVLAHRASRSSSHHDRDVASPTTAPLNAPAGTAPSPMAAPAPTPSTVPVAPAPLVPPVVVTHAPQVLEHHVTLLGADGTTGWWIDLPDGAGPLAADARVEPPAPIELLVARDGTWVATATSATGAVHHALPPLAAGPTWVLVRAPRGDGPPPTVELRIANADAAGPAAAPPAAA